MCVCDFQATQIAKQRIFNFGEKFIKIISKLLDLNGIKKMDSTGVILKSKLRGSLAWLLSKAYRGQVPAELADPLYVDNNGADQIKPQIIEALADAELFGSALATIYAQPKYLTLDHHGVIHVLIQKCVFTPDPDDASITETVLRQIAPLKVVSQQ